MAEFLKMRDSDVFFFIVCGFPAPSFLRMSVSSRSTPLTEIYPDWVGYDSAMSIMFEDGPLDATLPILLPTRDDRIVSKFY